MANHTENVSENRAKLLQAIDNTLSLFEQRYVIEITLVLSKIQMLVNNDYSEHYLAFSTEEPDKVSYSRTPENKENDQKRVKLSLGRYIRKHLQITTSILNDSFLNKFVDSVLINNMPTKDLVKVVEGNELLDAYKHAIGSSSCMTGEGNQNILKIYEINPDKIKMAIARNDARALLWFTDDGDIVLDRIYFGSELSKDILINWAKEKNYTLRDKLRHGVNVTLDCFEVKYFPYMDTFKFATFKSKRGVRHKIILTNDGNHEYILESTDGELGHSCENCGYPADTDLELDGCYYCSDCFNDIAFVCYECNNTYSMDEGVLIDNEQYCDDCASNFTKCEDCSDYILNNIDVYTLDDGTNLCSTCFSNTSNTCEKCDGAFRLDDLSSCKGSMYCEDCAHPCDDCDEPIFHTNKDDHKKDLCDECQKLLEESEKEEEESEKERCKTELV